MATLRENQVQPVQDQPVKQFEQRKPGPVYGLPVEKPKYETMGGAGQVSTQSSAGQVSTQSYTPGNAIPVDGSHGQKYLEESERQQKAYEANPRLGQAYTDEELLQKYWDIINAAGSNSQNNYSQRGGYVYDGNQNSELPGTGEKGWSYKEGTQRTVQEGTSGADEDFMSDADYAIIQALKKRFAEAQARGDQEGMNAAHEEAERIRARYNYSGGSDGSFYLPGGNSSGSSGGYTGGGTGGNYTGGSTVPDSSAKMDELRSLLEEWKKAATEQKQNSIDYAVDNAVKELERALEDAQPKYKEQMESVAKDEMQSLDNSALYAEMRGDKGGIGQSQYNEIQAAAAQNKLAVQQAQTKLSTDTARQIADLRAQGEFEKADAALEVAQTYLSQLMQLEQWAAEYNLSVAQFEASLQQWQAEYELSMKQFQTDTELSWAQIMGKTSDGSLTLSGQSQLASMGQTLLSAGIMPSDSQLSAMGITADQANQYLQTLQLSQAASSSGSRRSSSSSSSGSKSGSSTSTGYDDLAQEMFNSGITTAAKAKAYLLDQGYSSTLATAYANAYAEDYRTLKKQHDDQQAETQSQEAARNEIRAAEQDPLQLNGGGTTVYVAGYGVVSMSKLEELIKSGAVTRQFNAKTGKYAYVKK